MRKGSRGYSKHNSPMLRVTVMMFRDMVESVTLLNEEAWKAGHQGYAPHCSQSLPLTRNQTTPTCDLCFH